MKKNFLFLLVAFFVLNFSLTAQNIFLYPTNWWVGMKWSKVQILVRNTQNSFDEAKVYVKYPGITVTKIATFDNKKYLAVDVTISPNAKPGVVKFNINNEVVDWPLQARRKGNGTAFANGATSADLMYLIMPDRFSNGDPSNDRVQGMLDQTLRRDTVFNRHGGDLKGVQNHLDYLKDLGVTAIWLNPIWENDMPNRTEHGYAFTDHYKVDPRLGGNDAYKQLVAAAHAKGIKIIQDAVYNHTGIEHFLFKDQPDSTWFHRWPKFTQTSYKEQALFDPYASKTDIKAMQDGWFVPSMPDWDQSNPYVQNFLIQHAIWSMEEFGIDGWRIDTYAYNDLPFMNRCNKALYDEYPKVSIFGETWVHGVINQAYFCDNTLKVPFKSNLQATTDFQTLFYGIQPAVTQPFGWTEGVNKLYTTLSQDVLYKNPMNQVIFLDNHDVSRFYSVLQEDTAKYKTALGWLLTSRGIPQLYYGNEILMTGLTSPNDGYVRQDFPGGWDGDTHNKFTAQGRTPKENDIFNFVKKLANFRKSSSAIKTGKMMQYYPIDGVYVYFRYDNKQTVMCVMNTNDKSVSVDLDRFSESTNGFISARSVVDNVLVGLDKPLSLHPMSIQVLALQK